MTRIRLAIAIALVAAVAGLFVASGKAQTVFRLYSVLTGAEVIADQANPTGASFTTSVLAQYVTRVFFNATKTTVALLPTCNSSRAGYVYMVTDGSPVTFGATLASGGTAYMLALCDGTNWTAH